MNFFQSNGEDEQTQQNICEQDLLASEEQLSSLNNKISATPSQSKSLRNKIDNMGKIKNFNTILKK